MNSRRSAAGFRLVAAWLLGLVAAAALPSQAEERGRLEKPFLWRVERPGAKTSWLFGTIHLPRPELTALNEAIHSVLRSVDAVYTEIPNDPATLAAIAPHMLLPRGRTIEDELPADLLAEIRAEFARIAPGTPFAPFRAFKPWALALTLVMLRDQMENPGQLAMDTLIYQRAVLAGKEVGGLETVESQLAIFGELTVAEQTTMLRDTLRLLRTLGGNPTDRLAELYLAGDLPAITAELEKWSAADSDPALTARFLEKLLYARNETLAATIAGKLRAHPERSYFFAIGAAHFDGPRGLVALLEKDGFTVARVE